GGPLRPSHATAASGLRATGTSPACALRARRGGGPVLRSAIIIALCAMMAACGFHPMYAPGLAPQLATIYVEPMAERDGYELRNSLIDLLRSDGVQTGKRYRLTVRLNQTSRGVALQNDATITRYNDTLEASY